MQKNEKIFKKIKKILAFTPRLWYYVWARYARRYAMMREVAHLKWGNFRGVCPILNRAIKLKEVPI